MTSCALVLVYVIILVAMISLIRPVSSFQQSAKLLIPTVGSTRLIISTTNKTDEAIKADPFNKEEVKTYILQYKYVPDMITKRSALREQHLALAKSLFDKKLLVAGGAYAPNVDGATIIFKSTLSVVKDFVKNDPYFIAGLIPEHSINEWSLAIGDV